MRTMLFSCVLLSFGMGCQLPAKTEDTGTKNSQRYEPRRFAQLILSQLESESGSMPNDELLVSVGKITNSSGRYVDTDTLRERLISELRRSRVFRYTTEYPSLPGDFQGRGRVKNWKPANYIIEGSIQSVQAEPNWLTFSMRIQEYGGRTLWKIDKTYKHPAIR
jgi:hypothetical protein